MQLVEGVFDSLYADLEGRLGHRLALPRGCHEGHESRPDAVNRAAELLQIGDRSRVAGVRFWHQVVAALDLFAYPARNIHALPDRVHACWKRTKLPRSSVGAFEGNSEGG